MFVFPETTTGKLYKNLIMKIIGNHTKPYKVVYIWPFITWTTRKSPKHTRDIFCSLVYLWMLMTYECCKMVSRIHGLSWASGRYKSGLHVGWTNWYVFPFHSWENKQNKHSTRFDLASKLNESSSTFSWSLGNGRQLSMLLLFDQTVYSVLTRSKNIPIYKGESCADRMSPRNKKIDTHTFKSTK